MGRTKDQRYWKRGGERRAGAHKCGARNKPNCEKTSQFHHVSPSKAPPTRDATTAIRTDGPPIWKDAVHPQRIGSGRPGAALCSLCLLCQIGKGCEPTLRKNVDSGAYAPPSPNFHTGMPSFFALSARLSWIPEPGKMMTPIGSTSSI